MSVKKILVPTDFSSVSETAINHAAKVASQLNADVYLLHVVSKPSELDDAKLKLEDSVANLNNILGADRGHAVSRIGNIFEDIGDVARELDAELIVMGTHGAVGMQKLLGSHALKVITSSDIPFIVVQDKKINEYGYDDIVLPIDFTVETKQKLVHVANMAKYFNSKVHLVFHKENDEWLSQKVTRNVNYSKAFLKERGIEFDAKEVSGDFTKEIVRYATSIEADLISIMNVSKNGIIGILGNSYEQVLMTNEAQIPVLIVNPFESKVGGGAMYFS